MFKSKTFTNSLFSFFFCLSSLCLSSSASASGFQIFETGTPLIATAAVGQAVTQDASASFYNPAAMAQLYDSQIMIATQLLVSTINFKPNTSTTFTGNNGGKAGALLPGLSLYDVYSFSDDLKFGISLNSPYGGLVNYTDGWVGRYFVVDAAFVTMDLNPSFAYRINDWLAFGAGFFVEYASLAETINFPVGGGIEGQVDLRLHNYSPGYNLGLLFSPCDSTIFGLAYRSHVNHNLKGDTTFFRIANTPQSSAKIKIPQSVILSVAQEITPDFVLLLEGGWVNWEIFQSTVVQIDTITLTIPREWKNTYRWGVGAQYKFTSDLLLQTGFSYDGSPCTAENRLPDFPVDKQWRAGIGFIYTTANCVRLGVGYEYIDFGKAAINASTRLGTLSGYYSRNNASVFAINANFEF